MAKSRWNIIRQTTTIAITILLAFSVSCSAILGFAVSTAVSLCRYSSVEKEKVICTESCCAGIGTSPDCCCSFNEIPPQNKTFLSFDSSVYSYMCAVYTFDNYNPAELYSVDCEKKCVPEYIVYDIFRPPNV
jgi:hypothetical protein